MKSGEEWVKSEQKLFTTPNALFIGIYKGKVKSEEFLALRRNKKYKEYRQAPNHIPVKSGEEWVKSEQKLFTTPNALFIGIYKGKVKSEEFLALRRNKKYKE